LSRQQVFDLLIINLAFCVVPALHLAHKRPSSWYYNIGRARRHAFCAMLHNGLKLPAPKQLFIAWMYGKRAPCVRVFASDAREERYLLKRFSRASAAKLSVTENPDGYNIKPHWKRPLATRPPPGQSR
jgi:hypothetical protein